VSLCVARMLQFSNLNPFLSPDTPVPTHTHATQTERH
jgi:hypothetical protein